MSAITRRRFLAVSVIAAASGAVPVAGLARTLLVRKVDEVYDVIVVGTGIAGTMAAVSAAKKGSSVLLIDKMPSPGGSSANFSFIFRFDREMLKRSEAQQQREISQKHEGLPASPPDGFPGGTEASPEDNFTSKAVEVEAFLRNLGVRWEGLEGRPRKAGILEARDGCRGVLSALYKHMDQVSGLAVRTGCKADEILLDEKGGAFGIAARKDYSFDQESVDGQPNGVRTIIGCRQALVFATGGYARDEALFSSIDPALGFLAVNSDAAYEGATADSLKIMAGAGAAVRVLHPVSEDFDLPQMPLANLSFGMLVAPKTGNRFADEGGQDVIGRMIELQQSNSGLPPVAIFDSKSFMKAQSRDWVSDVRNAVGFRDPVTDEILLFVTLKQLAAFFRIPYQALKKTLDAYNNIILLDTGSPRSPLKEGKVKHIGRGNTPDGKKAVPINENGPFYAFPVRIGLSYTNGGVEVNRKAQACRPGAEPAAGKAPQPARDVVPRLYVAGEAAYHDRWWKEGKSAPGFFAVEGYIAGEEVASMPKREL